MKLWWKEIHQEKSDIFVNNIDVEELSCINRALDSCSEKHNIGKADIDSVAYNIEHLFKMHAKFHLVSNAIAHKPVTQVEKLNPGSLVNAEMQGICIIK